MRWWPLIGLGLSAVIHVAAMGAVYSVPKSAGRRMRTVTVFDAKPDKKKPKDPDKHDKPPEPKKPPVSKPILKAAAPPPEPANTPPPPTNAAPTPPGHAAMAAMPDFGLSLGGGIAVGGIAVPMGGGGGGGIGGSRQGAGGGGSGEKKVRGPAPKQTEAADLCVEDTVKPKVLERVQPHYSDDARAAGVEGPVRVELTVDATGTVTSARLVSGLGHGLDEAALTAAKHMKFSPATRCQKAVEAKFVITMRFQLGD